MKITMGEIEYEMTIDEFVDLIGVYNSGAYIPEIELEILDIADEDLSNCKDSYFSRRTLVTGGGRRYRLLVASKEFERKVTFLRGVNVCSKLQINNMKDWTLPTLHELSHLRKYHKEDFQEARYWTTSREYMSRAEVFDFKKGSWESSKINTKNYIRPVRRIYL
jgi:hypothetical protein